MAIPRQTELAAGDPILIRRNARKLGLINGEVLTCSAVQSDGSILTREGKTLPASFRDFAHGYVVTSHKSQGRTHDQVVIAAAQMDAKAAYVACSRGRHQVSLFTPDKAQLIERAEQSGDRLAASDVLDPISLRPAMWRRQEQTAWQHAVEQAMAGTDILTLRDLLGHSDTRMTSRYSHLTAAHLKRAVDKLPEVFEQLAAGDEDKDTIN